MTESYHVYPPTQDVQARPRIRRNVMYARLRAMLVAISIFIHVAVLALCGTVTEKTLFEIWISRPTVLTPDPRIVGGYVVATYIAQIGYSIYLLLTSLRSFKGLTLVSVQGLFYFAGNIALGLGSLCWAIQSFSIATVCLGIAAYAMLSPFLTFTGGYMPRHKALGALARLTLPSSAALHFTLVFNILLPVALLVALGPNPAPISQKSDQPLSQAIMGVVVITIINLFELRQLFYHSCFSLCVAGTVAAASLVTGPPKPRIIAVTSYILTAAHPIVWASSTRRRKYKKNEMNGEEEGARFTRLIDEDEETEVDFYGSVVNPSSTTR